MRGGKRDGMEWTLDCPVLYDSVADEVGMSDLMEWLTIELRQEIT